MSRVSLGGASFAFTAENRDLIVKSAQAEAAAKAAYAAIGKSAGLSADAVERAADRFAAAQKAEADAAAQATLKIIRAHNDAADAADKAAKRQAEAAAKAGGGFGDFAKSALGVATAITGVAIGLELVHKGIEAVGEATQASNQAVFALGKTFAGTTREMQAFGEAQAKVAGRSNTDATEALNNTRILVREYGYTNEQIQEVIKRSADLAALSGESLPEATRRVVAALRGEGDTAEELGLNLQQNVIQEQLATEAERKRYAGLDPLTKSQITYQKFLEQTNGSLGAAAERANEAAGAEDRLKAVTTNLAVSFGKELAPSIASAEGQLADFLEQLDGTPGTAARAVESLKITAGIFEVIGAAATLNIGQAVNKAIEVGQQLASANARIEARLAADKDPAAGQFGPTAAEVARAQAEQKQAEAAERDRQTDIAAIRKAARDAEAEANLRALDAQQRQADAAFAADKARIEATRDADLKAWVARKDAAISALEEERRQAKLTAEAHLADLERQKQGDEQAAAEAAAQAKAAVDVRKHELEEIRGQEDRDRDDARSAEDQDLADRRARADQEVETVRDRVARSRELEDRARADRRQAADADRQERRVAEDRELAENRAREDARVEATAQRLARERALEDRDRADAREQADRELAASRLAEDRERSAARAKEDADLDAAHDRELAAVNATHEQKLAAINEEIAAEKARSTAALKALDDESDAAKKDAAAAAKARDRVHDEELDDLADQTAAVRRVNKETLAGLKDQAQAEDDRHRIALASIESEKDARLKAIDEQLGLLDAADQADEQVARDRQLADAVTNARFGLKKAQSTGNQSEIVKAQQTLDDALAAITSEGVKRERDAARSKLLAQKDAIGDEVAAEKDAENERNRLRDQEITDARDTASTILDTDLAAIAARKDALQKSYEAEKEQASEALAARLEEISQRKEALTSETNEALAQLQERSEAEQTEHDEAVERINVAYAANKAAISARRLDEDQDRTDRRTAEDQDRADRRTKEDRELADSRAAQDRHLQEDRDRLAARRADEDRERTDRRTKDDAALAASRLAQDRRRADERTAEDQATAEAATRLQTERTDEDRQIAASRLAQDRRRADERADEDEALAVQLAAVAATLAGEKRAIDEHYNGAQGVITLARAAMAEADRLYGVRLDEAKKKFDAERDAINAVYSNANKTGLLDKLEEAKHKTDESLRDQRQHWEDWKNDLIQNKIQPVIDKTDELINKLTKVPAVPGGGGGSGPNPYGNTATGQKYKVPNGLEVELGSAPGSVAPNQKITNPPDGEVAEFIRQTFTSFIGPQAASDALAVWNGEGRRAYVGDYGTSFGPYQLHAGGGLADDFAARYHDDARDPSTWRQQILFVAEYVKAHGWNGQWHGAPADIANKRYAGGHLFDEPTLTYSPKSGARGIIGETGSPERLLGVAATKAYDSSFGQMATSAALSLSHLPTISLPDMAGHYTAESNALSGQVNAGSVYMDFRGAVSYDGRKFRDLVVEALDRAGETRPLNFVRRNLP